MPHSRPRDLTAAELELLKTPSSSSADSMPLAIPPGTFTPVSLLNPAGAGSASEAPTAAPPDAQRDHGRG